MISLIHHSSPDNFDDVENKLNAFHLLFNPILDNHAPIKRTKIRGHSNPCVTDKIRALRKLGINGENWPGKPTIRWHGQVIKILNEK